ncbi:MAG: Von Willebrand factor type A domain protein, associated with Flp pilus assembly [Candidatus Jettenia ecosi]|uniref:von Willebrand factor type A domain protein, associated with Flp pilus assembly n=1 Tax=Candidatus Jettenia ecosi TaxID=2494326 RepID=A0A533QAY6_9BACT|nr:MAG: Von Willebrand factor type A domain protein, associated with Flp pilus assembly [Candidatus Jettenia ecosi]
MRTRFQLYIRLKNERGATLIIVALLMVIFIGLAAFAVDIGHLCVVQNELQNAADAGALAGARFLYNEDGTAVNEDANQIAYNTATANMGEGKAVEVNWSGGNAGDVQRGHWSFAASTFTPNASLNPVDLINRSDGDLDADPDFINAVRVITRRKSSPASSFFARVFGYQGFTLQKEAVAYIGFAGTLQPGDVDQPIAICIDSILQNDQYQCTVGRMSNSDKNKNTTGWTDFNQENPCQGGTNANAVKNLVCGDGNPEPIYLGKDMATNGGVIASAFDDIIGCWNDWIEQMGTEILWNLTLPVITCPGNNVSPCEEVVGAVNVNVVWITDKEDPKYNDAPKKMEDWTSGDKDGKKRWDSFVAHFNLQNVDGSPAPYEKKSIYFKPDCNPHIPPTGTSGGKNFGILAKIPVLVK